MVKFCEACGNLYNHIIDEEGDFSYHCQLCGNDSKVLEKCVFINELNRNSHDYQLNSNMIHDNTLPRTRKIKCPNDKCDSNTEYTGNPEIVIFQYNPEMLTVGYICTVCQNYWKN